MKATIKTTEEMKTPEPEKIKKIIKLIANGEIDKALEIANDDIGLLFALGTSFGQNGNNEIAEKIFHKITQINPNLAEAYGNFGIALLNLHKYDEAKSKLRDAKGIFSKKGLKKVKRLS